MRAIATLKYVDLILAEDTRLSRRLLNHYGISTPLLSYHEHNENERTPEILDKLAAGATLALITDAGTPAVSDPGYRVVKAAASAGFRVVPIPGACAAVTALSASGLASNNFAFIGFAPKKDKARLDFLARYKDFAGTLIFYESPHRTVGLLNALLQVFGDKPGVLARELTKVYEEFIRGDLSQILQQLSERENLKGECVLLLDNTGAQEARPDIEDLPAEIQTALGREDTSASALAKDLAKKYGLPKNEIYQEILRIKNNDEQ